MSKKGENIYKRKDGRWEARYICSRDKNGNAKYGYCYGKSYQEAKNKQEKAMADLISFGLSHKSKDDRRFSSYCDEWIRFKKSEIKRSSYDKYLSVIEKYIKPQLGNITPDHLNSTIINNFGVSLLEEKSLSAKTVRDILTVTVSIIKYISIYCPYVKKPNVFYPKITKNEARVLSKSEQQRLIEYLDTDLDEFKFGALLALLTGMRIGEICALKWSDISLEERTICVSGSMQRIKNNDPKIKAKTVVSVDAAKTQSSIRIIPMSDYVALLCRKRYSDDPEAYVLSSTKNKYVEPRILQYHFKKYAADCGLDGIHFHSLRHSFATRCVEVGFDIKTLSEILGHADIKMTIDRYVHSSFELKRENMKKLSEIGY